MNAYGQNRLSWWLERFSPAVAAFAITVGVLVLFGWILNVEVFKSVLPGLTAMKVNTACGFILAGIALRASQPGMQNRYSRIAAPICVGLVLALGLLTLGEYLSGTDFGIDQILIRDFTNLPGDIPGRMALNSAVSFTALGAALLLLTLTRKDLIWAVHGLAAVVILTGATAFIGYAYDIEEFLRVNLAYTPMALHTSAVFVLLGLGIVNTRPDHAFQHFMTSDCTECKIVRRLLPATVGFTLVSGWLILHGHKNGYFSETAGLVLFVAGLWALILRNGYILYEADARRNQAEQELQSASQYMRSLIESSLDPLVTISPEGKITDVNEATILATGVPRKLLVGSDFSDYFTEPDKARAGYQEVFAKGLVTDYPLALRHVSGRVMDVLYNASVYHNAKGDVAGVFAAARDVTGRKRAEEELRAASLYARSLIEASLDPLVTISPDGKITDVNESTIQATGMPRKLLTGSDFSNYFTEPDKARSGYREVFTKGFVTDYPLTLRHVSGKTMDVLYNASVYRDMMGKVAGVFAAARDITGRKRDEERIRYLASIVESSDDAIIGKTLDGIITSWNAGAEKMYGYTASEAIGKPMSILIPPAHQDELPRILETIRIGKHVEHFETVRIKKNGEEIYVSLTISPISEAGGGIAGASTVTRDITEHKRADEELHSASLYARSLIEASPDPLVTISPEGKITDVNESTIRATGVTRKLLVGSDFSDYFTEPDKARAGYQEVFAKGFVTDYPLALRHVSGRVMDVLYNASVYRNAKGDVAGVFAAARDITGRMQAERDLRKYQEHLEELVRERTSELERLASTDFLTGVANRRSFMRLAEQELERYRRFGHPPSLLMLDIDHFKAVNDTYGHAAGDQVLIQLAQLAGHAIRKVDVLGRLGGEEFAVLLPETGTTLATQMAERLRQSIEATETTVEQGMTLRFTISIGVATLYGEDADIDALLRRADQALYEAKQSGRNKVCVNSQPARAVNKQG
jgi:diguanylate cyclase (GGDEF)-like protein/PAS domain S-box-containing protein